MLPPQALFLARCLDLLSLRERVAATNIANADTPGYRTRDIDFHSELARALERPDSGVPDPIAIREVGSLPLKNDGNDVSLEYQLQLLSETAIRFSVAALKLRSNLQSVRAAIHEGRRI